MLDIVVYIGVNIGNITLIYITVYPYNCQINTPLIIGEFTLIAHDVEISDKIVQIRINDMVSVSMELPTTSQLIYTCTCMFIQLRYNITRDYT
jgi:hypothetical protein